MNNKLVNQTPLEILSLFLSNNNSPIHGREISRQLNKNQMTIQLTLNKLSSNKILKMKSSGKNKDYLININNPYISCFLVFSEINKTLNLVDNFEISLIIKDLKNFTLAPIIIFGSYAKKYSNKKSDLDILILNDKQIDIEDIQSKYNIKIHCINMSMKDFEKGLKDRNSFQIEIMNNHIVCQGYEYLVNLWLKQNG